MSDSNQPAGGVQMDVAYVAHLARLHLTPEETARLQAQLDQVLGYVNQLRELDVRDVEPTAHAMPVRNVFRADEPREGLSHEAALANAPATRNGLFIVPKILE
jgi:aspartyl-tRNA(Asn)/glutamyl-tRNA(Gln) amidotransferase subunit C